MDLSSNQFSGAIPKTLAELTNLEKLMLEENKLKGEIPTQLGELTELSSLSLFWNGLTGEMPNEICARRDGGELHTLEADCNENRGKVTCECCTRCLH